MTNRAIADVLREMAIFYAMDGVAFKPIAYEEAADTVASLPEPVSTLYAREGLKGLAALHGVGTAIAHHIVALLQHGKFREHALFVRRFPVDVLALTSIEGVGPKTVTVLYEKLGIRTLADLEAAAKKGRLRGVNRLGEKTEAHILKGIARHTGAVGRHLLGDVLPFAQAFEQRLAELPGVEAATIAGSVRRMQETIGDLDVVVTAKNPQRVNTALHGVPEVTEVVSQGPTKTVVRLINGMKADIRVVAPNAYGAALQYFTGDKAHNIVVRNIAIKKGFTLNEYGLWRGKKRIAAQHEEDVYRHLGLDFMAPELRTSSGEIEAARVHHLPQLLSYDSLRGDLHVHTDWDDGSASISDMAEAARDRQLSYIAITDHTKPLALAKEIRKINRLFRGSFTIFHGVEANILKDGAIDFKDSALAQLDIVGAAVHAHFTLTKKQQTAMIIRAMENPHVDMIFHPTGRLLLRREPYAVDMPAIISAAADTRTVLEINAFPDRLDLRDTYVRMAVDAGVTLAINSDAHAPEHFAHLALGIGTARRGWARKADVLNTKSVEELREWLDTPKNKRP